MEEKIQEFKDYWSRYKSFISLELVDYEIAKFIKRSNNRIPLAVDYASDYLLANGLADVEE